MANILNKIKLQVIINTLNAKSLTRSKIQKMTSNFSKSEVLDHKKKTFAKLVKHAPHTIEECKALKSVVSEFKLGFNLKANQLLKQQFQKTKELLAKPRPIDFIEFKLLNDEEAYLKLGSSIFFDLPHIKQLNYKKYKYLVLTNKRLILMFEKNKNSYYFSKYNFKFAFKFILIKDNMFQKSGIFLLSKNNRKLLSILKKLQGDN